MPKNPETPRPTDAELAILRVLWNLGPSTVREVHETLGRDTAYTTVLKTLQIMMDKRLVKRDEKERTHIYAAAEDEKITQRRIVKNLLEKAFGGSAGRLALQALSAKRATPEEMRQIRKLLDQHEKSGDQ